MSNLGGSQSGDIFLDIVAKKSGKIKGECAEPGHEGDILLKSWGWSFAQSSSLGSTKATGRRVFRNLTCVKYADTGTTGLLSTLATNDEIKQAKITMRKAGGDQYEYFKFKIEKGRIVEISLDVDEDGRLIERITFAFAKVEAEYMLQQTTGLKGASSTFQDEILDT